MRHETMIRAVEKAVESKSTGQLWAHASRQVTQNPAKQKCTPVALLTTAADKAGTYSPARRRCYRKAGPGRGRRRPWRRSAPPGELSLGLGFRGPAARGRRRRSTHRTACSIAAAEFPGGVRKLGSTVLRCFEGVQIRLFDLKKHCIKE